MDSQPLGLYPVSVLSSRIPEGFVLRPTKAFATLAGPFYCPPDGDKIGCGFLADERHANKRGVVHGGMIGTAFDVALGNACWDAASQRPCATVQLNVQFLGAVKLGEFAFVAVEVVRVTRTMVFVRGVMAVGDRKVAMADGVWKILEWRGEPFVP